MSWAMVSETKHVYSTSLHAGHSKHCKTCKHQECTWHDGTLCQLNQQHFPHFLSSLCPLKSGWGKSSVAEVISAYLGCVLRANSSNSRNRLVHATAVWGEIASSHCAVGQLTFISRNLRSWIHIPVLINIKLCQTHHYIPIRYQTLYQTLYQYCIVL